MNSKNVELNSVGAFDPGEYGSVEVNGVGSCPGSFACEELEVNGVLKCTGDIRADEMEVNGTLKCTGRLDAGEADICGAVSIEASAGIEQLSVDGTLSVGAPLQADAPALECREVECDGSLVVKGRMTAKTVEVDGALSVHGPSLECERLECDGSLKVDGQISADLVEAEGSISAQEIVGDKVCITSRAHSGFYAYMGGKRIIDIQFGIFSSGSRRNRSVSHIDLIEATTIQLEDVTAHTVNGTNISIGPNCVIENLDCNGTLQIDPAAQVKNITGEYVMEE